MKIKTTLFFCLLASSSIFAMQLGGSCIDPKIKKNISNIEKISNGPDSYKADLNDGSVIKVSELGSGLECKKFASKDSTEFEELDDEYFYFIAALHRDKFGKTK